MSETKKRISQGDVKQAITEMNVTAADASASKVRLHLGRGSLSTIQKALLELRKADVISDEEVKLEAFNLDKKGLESIQHAVESTVNFEVMKLVHVLKSDVDLLKVQLGQAKLEASESMQLADDASCMVEELESQLEAEQQAKVELQTTMHDEITALQGQLDNQIKNNESIKSLFEDLLKAREASSHPSKN